MALTVGLEFVPDGTVATFVTEFFDCSRSPEEGRNAVKNGTVWIDAITPTHDRLERVCTGGTPAPAQAADATR